MKGTAEENINISNVSVGKAFDAIMSTCERLGWQVFKSPNFTHVILLTTN